MAVDSVDRIWLALTNVRHQLLAVVVVESIHLVASSVDKDWTVKVAVDLVALVD